MYCIINPLWLLHAPTYILLFFHVIMSSLLGPQHSLNPLKASGYRVHHLLRPHCVFVCSVWLFSETALLVGLCSGGVRCFL
jgi:hypothetical protein